jgi:hypothetical protein
MESHRTPLGGGGTMEMFGISSWASLGVTRKTTMYRSTIRLIVTALSTVPLRICFTDTPHLLLAITTMPAVFLLRIIHPSNTPHLIRLQRTCHWRNTRKVCILLKHVALNARKCVATAVIRIEPTTFLHPLLFVYDSCSSANYT